MGVRRSRSLELRDAGAKGRGVFATRPFGRNETVIEFGGRRTPFDDLDDFTYTLQVDHGVFLGPSGDIDDYVNHSCDPSSGLVVQGERSLLVALRRLLPGDEITFDYSTSMHLEPALDRCYCGAPACRGRIDRFLDLDPELQQRYVRMGIVPPFLVAEWEAGRRP